MGTKWPIRGFTYFIERILTILLFVDVSLFLVSKWDVINVKKELIRFYFHSGALKSEATKEAHSNVQCKKYL